MKIDKQKVIIVISKYISYFINIVIIFALLGFVAWWIYFLYQSAAS